MAEVTAVAEELDIDAAFVDGFHFHGRLVGLDLGDHVAGQHGRGEENENCEERAEHVRTSERVDRCQASGSVELEHELEIGCRYIAADLRRPVRLMCLRHDLAYADGPEFSRVDSADKRFSLADGRHQIHQ